MAFFESFEVLVYIGIVATGVIFSFKMIEAGEFNSKGLIDFLAIGVTLVVEFQNVIKTAPDVANISGPPHA